ncbi:very short patch repair endonuclease [Pseudomonas sp. NPDC090201]|uniref:very short patch repair endonuclease n=1 Tax=Pseudomonas sp. NPDC090201 TaxID=3364475 RepID=UPI003802F6AB
MTDVVDAATRSRMMSGIKSKNTSPEILIRKALHARGFRFRIHVSDLPGTPDLVLPKYKAVVFVHGCFWHGHGCRYFKIPQTRPKFWEEKIHKNQARDYAHLQKLLSDGWRPLIVWECAVRMMRKQKTEVLVDMMAFWLHNGMPDGQIDEEGLKSCL